MNLYLYEESQKKIKELNKNMTNSKNEFGANQIICFTKIEGMLFAELILKSIK